MNKSYFEKALEFEVSEKEALWIKNQLLDKIDRLYNQIAIAQRLLMKLDPHGYDEITHAIIKAQHEKWKKNNPQKEIWIFKPSNNSTS